MGEIKIMDDSTKWTFPKNISLTQVSEYAEKFENNKLQKKIIFDLSRTTDFHSSFIGFLINSKFESRKNNKELCLVLSYPAERILAMLNIINFFLPEIVLINKKTA